MDSIVLSCNVCRHHLLPALGGTKLAEQERVLLIEIASVLFQADALRMVPLALVLALNVHLLVVLLGADAVGLLVFGIMGNCESSSFLLRNCFFSLFLLLFFHLFPASTLGWLGDVLRGGLDLRRQRLVLQMFPVVLLR